MPFIGRYTKYPLYPQFGQDPTILNNVLVVAYEQDSFTPGQTLDYQFKTGDVEIRLFDMAVEFIQGEVDFTIFEGATCTDGVTQVFPRSTNRNSAFVTSVFASSNPTAISGGITLEPMEHFGMSSPVIGLGDAPPASVNYISMQNNSNYIFRFHNVSPDTIIDFRFLLLWAE